MGLILTFIEAVASKIKEEYPLATVYPEPVSQGLNPPCFMISFDQVERKGKLSKWQQTELLFDINYFPAGSSLECYSVQETLLKGLQVLELGEGKHARCHGLRGRIVDDVLHIQGRAKLHSSPINDTPTMQELEQESEVSYG